MRNRYFSWLAVVAALGAILPLLSIDSAAQATKEKADKSGKFGGAGGYIKGKEGTPDDPAAPVGPTPRTADGKVDFTGVWLPGTFGFASLGPISLQPWAEALQKERRANLSKDDPQGQCLPGGVPRLSPYPYKILQTPDVIAILFEGNVHSYRQIFVDGRTYDPDLEPLWMGESIGKWEGKDTLIVDTRNFNDKTWLNGNGMPHSDQLRVVEKYTRPDLGHLEIEITLEDPKAFTKPSTFKRTHTLTKTWEIHEYVCNEYPVDTPHIVGK